MSQFNFGPAKSQIEELKGAANGIASLDADGKLPETQMPIQLVVVNGKLCIKYRKEVEE